jgi:tRNA dimethylallyltransferase
VTPLICIVGPTASGKSNLALKLAQEIGGEIVNADSRQIYREMIIGTAKPSLDEQALVKHHLIDVTTLREPWSAGDFVRAADEAIADIHARDKIPVVVGGTGLYVRSLIEGLDIVPDIDPSVRKNLQARLADEGLTKLYSELAALDPEAHARLKPGDTQRILRALEVVLQTGQTLAEYWQKNPSAPRYEAVMIGMNLPRPVLHERINERVHAMMAGGLAREARNLWDQFPQNAVLSKTIGYAEWPVCTWNPFAAEKLIALNTRQFAKRQMTWFGKNEEIVWVDVSAQDGGIAEAMAVLKT